MLCLMGDPPQTQAVILARCCSGVHLVSSVVWVTGAANAASSPHSVIHTHPHTVFCKLSQSDLNTALSHAKNCFAHPLVCVPAECLYPLYIRQEQRAEKGRREDVVQYSLVDVAGHYAELQGVLIYYRGQWSMKSWRWAERGANPFSPSPCRPHLPSHPSPPRPRVFLSPSRPCPALAVPSWALAPSMRLARLSSCRGSAVVSVGLEGCLSKEKGKAGALPRCDDITSL